LGVSLLVLYLRCCFHFFADTVKLGMPCLAPLDGEKAARGSNTNERTPAPIVKKANKEKEKPGRQVAIPGVVSVCHCNSKDRRMSHLRVHEHLDPRRRGAAMVLRDDHRFSLRHARPKMWKLKLRVQFDYPTNNPFILRPSVYDNNLNFFFSTTQPEFQPNKHVRGLRERKSGGMMPKVALVSE
jgi:hypothetical protein